MSVRLQHVAAAADGLQVAGEARVGFDLAAQARDLNVDHAAAAGRIGRDEVRTRLKDTLADFKIPRRIWICAKADLPFTDSGKIEKTELARLLTSRRS